MSKLKVEYPFIEENGNENSSLIKHYAENEKGEKFFILQVETGLEYYEAVDVYPCRYTYKATDKKIEEPEELQEFTEAKE